MQNFPNKVKLVMDGSVVTRDGEFLGTWECLDDAVWSFTPEGENKPVLADPFRGLFCRRIAEWQETARSS